MMANRILNVYDQMSYVCTGIGHWFYDTTYLLLDIVLEFLDRSLDLAIVIFNLVFQVIIFFRDLCIETMQTFANVFRGIVNVVGSIDSDDVEDFASACIVVILWIGLGQFLLRRINKNHSRYNPLRLFFTNTENYDQIPTLNDERWIKSTARRKSYGPRKKRNSTRL